MHWQDLPVAHIDGSNVLLLVSLLTPIQSRQPFQRDLLISPLGDLLSLRHVVSLSGRTGNEEWKKLNVLLTANSCSKQVMSHPHLLCLTCPVISSASNLARPWAMTMTCDWLDKTIIVYKEYISVKGWKDADALHAGPLWPPQQWLMIILIISLLHNLNNIIRKCQSVYLATSHWNVSAH